MFHINEIQLYLRAQDQGYMGVVVYDTKEKKLKRTETYVKQLTPRPSLVYKNFYLTRHPGNFSRVTCKEFMHIWRKNKCII